jgi:hypothetical protein
MNMLREPEVCKRSGLGKTRFKEVFIDTGRLRWVRVGRIKMMPEHELDAALADLVAARDAAPLAPPAPALAREAYMKGAHQKRRRKQKTAITRAERESEAQKRRSEQEVANSSPEPVASRLRSAP